LSVPNATDWKSLSYTGISVFADTQAKIFLKLGDKMKNFKGFALGLVLGLGLAISSIGFAQNVTQADQKKEAASCCAMESCCKGDSCSMKEHAKKDQSMTHSSHEGCCCCSGDSCDMKMKHDMKDKQ
jgi:hypothetical protein